MEPERFIERILETENLTDELEDKPAQQLLDWGLAELGPLLQASPDPQFASEQVTALMAVMRKINRLVGRLAERSPAAVSSDFAALDELIRALRPELAPAAADECAQAAEIVTQLDTSAALDFITRWRAPTSLAAAETRSAMDAPAGLETPADPAPLEMQPDPAAPETPAPPPTAAAPADSTIPPGQE